MATKPGKAEILEAMRGVLQEYRDETHTNRSEDCPLCQLYSIGFKADCSNCPMHIFNPEGNYGCVDRNCAPVTCIGVELDKVGRIELNAVIMFYERSIAYIETMSEVKVSRTDYSFLKKIDKQVTIEHGLL